MFEIYERYSTIRKKKKKQTKAETWNKILFILLYLCFGP